MSWLEWLRPALHDASEAELLAELESGRAQLWIGERCAIVTQQVMEIDGPCLHVWLAGGALNGVLELRAGIEAWARGAGCRSITIDGRPGWRRVLNAFGYRIAGHELKRML